MDEMRSLVEKFPEGYEGWEKENGGQKNPLHDRTNLQSTARPKDGTEVLTSNNQKDIKQSNIQSERSQQSLIDPEY
jgi:hypothetical protein